MKLLVSCGSWFLTYNDGREANGVECCEMSDKYVTHLRQCFEEDYGEPVEVIYIDETHEINEFEIIRN